MSVLNSKLWKFILFISFFFKLIFFCFCEWLEHYKSRLVSHNCAWYHPEHWGWTSQINLIVPRQRPNYIVDRPETSISHSICIRSLRREIVKKTTPRDVYATFSASLHSRSRWFPPKSDWLFSVAITGGGNHYVLRRRISLHCGRRILKNSMENWRSWCDFIVTLLKVQLFVDHA